MNKEKHDAIRRTLNQSTTKHLHGFKHRYRSAKIDCLSFVYVPATSAAHNRILFFFFSAAAIYSTNEENTRS